MNLVKELPKLTKIEIVLGEEGKYNIRSLQNGDILEESFDSIKAAVTYSVGAFLIPTNSA
ncbi:MAG: hypothetical protein ISR72_09685 [Methylobacter sp.]|nr:hypothetical protein [Methylobacter sp.]